MISYRYVLYFVWKLLPTSFRNRVRLTRRENRIKKIASLTESLDLKAFEQAINELPLKKDGVLFIHSGADWFRNVEGGSFKVLQMMLELMESGTVVMPSFPFDGMMSDYVETQTFDVVKSPSKMGLVTELFRRTDGVRRSLHPSHSICAKGSDAKYLLNDHQNCIHPFESKSPFGRVIELRGQILLIGVGLEVLTHVHTCEDKLGAEFPLKVYERKIRDVTVIDHEQNPIKLQTYVHDKRVSIRKNINKIEQELMKKGILFIKSTMGVDIRLIDAYSLEEFLIEKAKSGYTIYD